MTSPPNPYAPPPDNSPLAAPATGPIAKLHTPNAVALATLLGTPVAGALLIADNERRLGRDTAAWLTLVGGLAATAALLAIAFWLPAGVGAMPAVVTVLLMRQVTLTRQSTDLQANAAAGAQSMWFAVGAGVASIIGLGAVIVGLAIADVLPSDRVKFPPANEVYYEDGATEGDARKLGEAMERIGFFDKEAGKTVTVSKVRGGLAIAFIVQDGVWNDTNTVSQFEALGRTLSSEAFNDPGHIVEVQLCNDLSITKKTISLR